MRCFARRPGLLGMQNHYRRYFAAAALAGVTATAVAQTRPAVLELFTSEGCSSCPPAEIFIGELAQRRDVLPLSFHVDYWDNLGWRDRFSSADATQRQRIYARVLHRAPVYTPQAIIDGQVDIVGSERQAITTALAVPREGVPVNISLHAASIQVRVGPSQSAGAADVLLVGYLRQATSRIGRGENAGRTLQEANVVRTLRVLGPWDGNSNDYRVALDSLPGEVTDVAVLVQAQHQGLIFGAATQPLR
jgi:hypothetical protein